MLYYYQNGFEGFERHFATTELDEKLTYYCIETVHISMKTVKPK
jgi:hypothetical protein